jgi:hypothetical protein
VAAQRSEFEREYAYILGEAFQVRELVSWEYQKELVGNLPDFFNRPGAEKEFNILLKWCPEKIFSLLQSGLFKYSKPS